MSIDLEFNKPEIKEVLITPDIAKEMLEKNFNNRNILANRVKQYADDMRRGLWTYNQDLITLNEKGELTNGQHRLMAIIKANTPIKMFVGYNLPNDCVIDKGRERSTGDALYMRGLIEKEVSTTHAIALANAYLRISEKSNKISDTLKGEFISANTEYILRSLAISKAGKLTGVSPRCAKAGIQAAILGALKCGISETSLFEFFTLVNSGYPSSARTSEEQSVGFTLIRYIDNVYTPSGGQSAKELTMVTQMAIRDYVKKCPRYRLYKEYENVYITKSVFN